MVENKVREGDCVFRMDPIKSIKLRWLQNALHDISYELSRSQFSRFASQAWQPAINAYRCQSCLRICVDLAGVEKSEIEPIGTDVNSITWFNGLILGLAAERDIDAIGLFGEISETTVPQPLAAKSIVKAFAKMENITLDTKLLDEQYEEVLDRTQKDKEPSRFRPGIG